MKSVKTILILAVAALLVTGPAVAGGKDYDKGKGKGRAKHKSPPVSHALLLYPDASSGTALTKLYREDPLYQEKDTNPFQTNGYVINAGPFILDIYNQGDRNRGETAEDVQLVVAINDLEQFESALINGYELTRDSFTQTPQTPRFYSNKKFPRHQVYPAYYAEIPVGAIALGELAAVGVDIKAVSGKLLAHFDAYGRGTSDRCDDDCHAHDGKKGRGKKYDCDGRGKHHKGCCDRHHGCAQVYDIQNKLSHDVTQTGPASLSVVFAEANPTELAQDRVAVFNFSVKTVEPLTEFTVTAVILDLDDNNQAALVTRFATPPDSGDIFLVVGEKPKASYPDGYTIQWPAEPETALASDTNFSLLVNPGSRSERVPEGNYSLQVCATEVTDNVGAPLTACRQFGFTVAAN